jgi:cytochrome P450
MYQSVQTSADHLVYGHGNQACPGRFFAAHEAKVVTSRILMNYDFKLKEKPAAHPFSHASGIMTEADGSVEFLFKKREWSYQ